MLPRSRRGCKLRGLDPTNPVIGWHSFGPEETTKVLLESGIPGIKYLDQGSRAGGKGTSNFVVFDDQIPKILGRE